MADLSKSEKIILDRLLAGDDDTLALLRTQLNTAKVSSRKFTGVGFFTHFGVPNSIERVAGRQDFEVTDVCARIKGLDNDAGFILFVRDGVISSLEGYAYGNEEWPKDWNALEPYYVQHEPPDSPMVRPCNTRDLAQLRTRWARV